MGNFTQPLPIWNAPGTEPPDSLKNEGWKPEQKPPADYFNWFQTLTYKVLDELQQRTLTELEIQAIADAVQANLDMHKTTSTNVHGSTSSATANTIMQRDTNGQANVGAPTAASHIARRQDVDAIRSDGTKAFVVELRTVDPVNPEPGRIWFIN